MPRDPIENVIAKFEYKVLDKIYGRPKLSSIVHLYNQIKRNAQKVITTLGGGRYGYLPLVLPAIEFNRLPNSSSFIRPTDPGIFKPIAAGSDTNRTTRASTSEASSNTNALSSAEIATLKAEHDEKKWLFLECNATETALKNLIVEAIDDSYLLALRNRITQTIDASIPKIMEHLIKTYGRMTPLQLAEQKKKS